MPLIQQDILRDDCNGKQSLISESIVVIQIGVHYVREGPDQHVVRLASRVSRITTVRKSLLS
jgi:hypothetical protein